MNEFGELRAEQARALLQALAQVAEAVVIDLPCGGAAANQAAVHGCDSVNLVVDSDPTSLLPAEAALARLARWRLPAGRVGLVLTSRHGLPAPLMPSQVSDRLGTEVRAWVPQLSLGQLDRLEREGPQGLAGAFAAALRPGVVERLCRGDAEARYRFVLGRAAAG